jgi:hypothetical protein
MMLADPRSFLAHIQRFRAPDDRVVRQWKECWAEGAHARWSDPLRPKNPYASGTRRAAAWDAGWNWAERQPDRRRGQTSLAHPRRRRTDTIPRLVRGARAGALGLSVLTVFGGLWRIRRGRHRRLQRFDGRG